MIKQFASDVVGCLFSVPADVQMWEGLVQVYWVLLCACVLNCCILCAYKYSTRQQKDRVLAMFSLSGGLCFDWCEIPFRCVFLLVCTKVLACGYWRGRVCAHWEGEVSSPVLCTQLPLPSGLAGGGLARVALLVVCLLPGPCWCLFCVSVGLGAVGGFFMEENFSVCLCVLSLVQLWKRVLWDSWREGGAKMCLGRD